MAKRLAAVLAGALLASSLLVAVQQGVASAEASETLRFALPPGPFVLEPYDAPGPPLGTGVSQCYETRQQVNGVQNGQLYCKTRLSFPAEGTLTYAGDHVIVHDGETWPDGPFTILDGTGRFGDATGVVSHEWGDVPGREASMFSVVIDIVHDGTRPVLARDPDFNGDHCVDGLDLSAIVENDASTALDRPARYDLDADGDFDPTDIDLLLTRFDLDCGTPTPPPPGPVFSDIAGNVHAGNILLMAEAGIAGGFGDGTYRPGRVVTRGQMATFLTRALDLVPGAGPTYADIGSDVHGPSISAVAALGITSGYPDGTFRPGLPVTREQVATFLTRAFDLPLAPPPFSDVRGPHAQPVGAVAAAGIAAGFGDGTYQPALPVPRSQMASFLARALGLS